MRRRLRIAAMCTLAGIPTAGFAGTGPLFSNAGTTPADPGLATGALSASGAAAPVGNQWSELQRDADGANALGGVACHAASQAGAYRAADDFTVAGYAYGWRITGFTLFAYVSSGGSPQPFAGINLRIWDGPPRETSSNVVWDSAAHASSFTPTPMGLLRIFNSAAPLATPVDTTRPIWQLAVTTPGLQLAPGSYWLDWQIQMTSASASAYSPSVTILAARGRPGANAQQFKPLAGVPQWTGVLDAGKPAAAPDVAQDLPFLIMGEAAPPPCLGDADGNGAIAFADIGSALENWGLSYSPGTGPGDGDGNGLVEFADVVAVLQNWGVPCGG